MKISCIDIGGTYIKSGVLEDGVLTGVDGFYFEMGNIRRKEAARERRHQTEKKEWLNEFYALAIPTHMAISPAAMEGATGPMCDGQDC